MVPTVWQQLGGLVYTGENLSSEQLDRFKGVGGAWICPWVYQDSGAEKNLSLVSYWRSQKVRVGGVFNCFGGDPEKDALNIAKITNDNKLDPIVLDCEADYQYPNPGCQKLPYLLSSLKPRVKAEICVCTNGLNDSMIWNGGQLGYKKSCWNLRIRVSPQWYSSPKYEGIWTDPESNMKWLYNHGDEDNFFDPTQRYKRAVPLSYVHPCVEPTGVEDADLEVTIDSLLRAKKYGFTMGLQLYALERVPAGDWEILADYHSELWY